jgi:hypothetical protein
VLFDAYLPCAQDVRHQGLLHLVADDLSKVAPLRCFWTQSPSRIWRLQENVPDASLN